MEWKGLMPTFNKELESHPFPHVLIIQLGSNDLGKVLGKDLIENIKLDLLRLRTLYPHLKLVWSEILPRRYWHFADNFDAIEETRKRVNTAVRKFLREDIDKGYVIRHRNITHLERDLYRFDGTHLSDIGNSAYLNNMQAALEMFLQSDIKIFE